MRAKLAVMFVGAVCVFVLPACYGEKDRQPDKLIAYTYDSFASEWGAGPIWAELFKEAVGSEIEFRSVGDTGSLVGRVVAEGEESKADLVVGIDNNLLRQALDAEILEAYDSGNLERVPEFLRFDSGRFVTPYDYGFFSINFDSERLASPPTSLEALTSPQYKDSLILLDPRTSGPGLAFLLWTREVYGDAYLDYWSRLMPSVLTIADSWDTGYSLFVSGEAPMVLSYTTSPAYHAEYEGTERYKATLFERGNYIHIEGAGILKGARNRELAEKFIDLMLTPPFQEVLFLTNFMFPVDPTVEEPASYRVSQKPDLVLGLDPQLQFGDKDDLINPWLEIVTR